MKRKILILISLTYFLLSFILPVFAQDSDVVWTKDMGVDHGVLRVDFVQQGKSILVGGEKYLRNLDTQTGEIKKDYGIGGRLYEVAEDGNSFYVANGFIINKYVIESGQIIDNIAIEMTPEYIYDGGDTNWKFKSSVLTVIKQIPNSNLMLGVWQAESKDPNRALIVTLLVIDKSTKKIIKNFGQGQFGAIIEVSPDGKYFVLGLNEGIVELWDAKTFTKIKTLGNFAIGNMSFNSNGSKLMIVGSGPTDINLFDVETRTLIKSWDFEAGNKYSNSTNLLFISDDYVICSGGFEASPDPIFCTRIYELNDIKMLKQYDYRGQALSVINNNIIIANYTKVNLINFNTNSVSQPNEKEYPIIFPNPVTNKVNINIPNNLTGNISIRIIDIHGKIILYKEEPTDLKLLEIDVSFLSKDIYFIKIDSKNYSITYKFVKE